LEACQLWRAQNAAKSKDNNYMEEQAGTLPELGIVFFSGLLFNKSSDSSQHQPFVFTFKGKITQLLHRW